MANVTLQVRSVKSRREVTETSSKPGESLALRAFILILMMMMVIMLMTIVAVILFISLITCVYVIEHRMQDLQEDIDACFIEIEGHLSMSLSTNENTRHLQHNKSKESKHFPSLLDLHERNAKVLIDPCTIC